jgi:Ca2+-binding RTX toxin-like protein
MVGRHELAFQIPLHRHPRLVAGVGDLTILTGGNGKDSLYGDDGDDVLRGGHGKDLLDGGIGNDELHGGTGKDSLDGGEGNDDLYGGRGKDSFNFGPLFGDPTFVGADTIHDFEDGKEKIDLSATGLTAGDVLIADVGGNSEITGAAHGKIIVLGAAGLIDASDLILAA